MEAKKNKALEEVKQAVEKLIEMIGSHDASINTIQMIQELQKTKLDKIDKLNDLESRIIGIESNQALVLQRLNTIEARLGIVELDAAGDHHLDEHNQHVVQDWMREHDAGINTDMIALTDLDIKGRYEQYNQRRKRY